MPITRTLDAAGQLLHDCKALGCETSWDGYLLKEPAPETQAQLADLLPAGTPPLKPGDRVPGATDPGDRWAVSKDGTTARLKP